jgi:hypothetical protein
VLAATVQTAEFSGFCVPKIRAALGRVQLNFLSVSAQPHCDRIAKLSMSAMGGAASSKHHQPMAAKTIAKVVMKREI